MLNIITVSDALNRAFDELTGALAPDEDTYVTVSAAWTNPAGKLVSMHISLSEGEDDLAAQDTDTDIDVTRPRLAAVEDDDLDPDYVR